MDTNRFINSEGGNEEPQYQWGILDSLLAGQNMIANCFEKALPSDKDTMAAVRNLHERCEACAQTIKSTIKQITSAQA